MRTSIALLFVLNAALAVVPAAAASKKAKNVIVFLADAGGTSTVNAASIHGYNKAQSLYVQNMPNIGLSDTSTNSSWVSDSAAGMTAIVTGVKTENGLISMGPDTVRGKKDGTVLKTLLEEAEERGLATGVITNVNIADATPAACYAHANDRKKAGEIFLQVFRPRYGDGVDVVIGAGRSAVYKAVKELGEDLDAVAAAGKREVRQALSDVPAGELRPIVVSDKEPDVAAAARLAIERLSKNKKGYFLMIEWDAHTDNPKKGLDNLVGMDKLIREIAGTVNLKETLLVFTADHSFDMRVRAGQKGEPLLKGLDEWREKTGGKKQVYLDLPNLRLFGSHTGEEVLVAAQGPGSEQVKGFLPNTRIHDIILQAWGWKKAD